MRRPENSTRPSLGAYRPTIRRATVDLPQPDSPTSASVSPRSTSRSTRSTARRMRRGSRSMTRLSHGRDTSKSRLTASSRSSRGMEPAGREARSGRQQVRSFGQAALEALRAARVEGAAARDGVEARHGAFDLNKTGFFSRNSWDGAHEPYGVGVARRVDHFAHRADLGDAP